MNEKFTVVLQHVLYKSLKRLVLFPANVTSRLHPKVFYIQFVVQPPQAAHRWLALEAFDVSIHKPIPCSFSAVRFGTRGNRTGICSAGIQGLAQLCQPLCIRRRAWCAAMQNPDELFDFTGYSCAVLLADYQR